jgi:UDP-N-acetylglucosamine diphosphorylase/glucosamine-1-phosphate N-acetyltransferase
MDINLFDTSKIKQQLKPFTYTRPIGDLRIGISKISEKWEHYGFRVGFVTDDYLASKFETLEDGLNVVAHVFPTAELVEAIKGLSSAQGLWHHDEFIAGNEEGEVISFDTELTFLNHTWDIFRMNRAQLIADFERITEGRQSQAITDPHTIVYGQENLFIEEGAQIKAAVIDASNGPVYIGKNTVINAGAMINGAFALGDYSTINMGTKMRGDTTIGPHCKVGGEISNSVFLGYSNKGHEGFVGNSVIGEWCNIGADSNSSNLKNNYAEVRLWDYASGRFAPTGLQFCGLMMADHAKCGINTMFNTGTVVGVGANVFGAGYPRNFIPSFSWGGAAGLTTFQLKKFDEVASAVMKRRNIAYDQLEKAIIDHIFELTKAYRIWDN